MWLGPSPLPLWAWQKLASLVRGRRKGPHRHLGVSWKPHTKARPLMLILSFFHWRFLSTSLSETLYGSPRLLDNGPCRNPASREEAETKGLTSSLASSPHPLPPTFHRVRGKVGLRLVNGSLPAPSPCPPTPTPNFHCCQLCAPPSLWLLLRTPPPGLSPGSQHQLRSVLLMLRCWNISIPSALFC